MGFKLLDFYKISPPVSGGETDPERSVRFKRIRWATFLSATTGYGIYYVCRLSMNVIRKPIVEDGVFTETQLGIIGSCLFFVYAVGKLTNGFLADRSNVKRFMSTGLLCSALINLCLGFTNSFFAFVLLWGLNGWFQSMGAASGVVSLTRWYSSKERGTFYGFWSASHNLGEALTFISIALLVSWMGWRYGMIGAGVIGLLGFLMMLAFMRDTPQSQGFLLDRWGTSDAHSVSGKQTEEFNKAQKAVLKNPAIWILALSSAFMYISRYAVNSWGVFYLEAQKGYSTLDASFIISISSVCGIVGTVFSGIISDKFFAGSRNVPALIFGLMNVSALCIGSGGTFLGGCFGDGALRFGHWSADLFFRRTDGCRYCSQQCFGSRFGSCRYSELYRSRFAGCDEWHSDRRSEDGAKWSRSLRFYIYQLVLDWCSLAFSSVCFVGLECRREKK